jgi:phosphoribosylformylglycinamidine cyclo-ligase
MTDLTKDQVDYYTLDNAKIKFINAARSTLSFASEYGFVPDETLGASANIFSLNLQPFIKAGLKYLAVTLLPEGLGTADDARPEDLNSVELIEFWYNIGVKIVACITNDAISSGLQAVLLSLYLPSADPEQVFNDSFTKGFLQGIVDSCKKVGCVYLSGETPQLREKISPNKLDIAGATFAIQYPEASPISGNLAVGDKIVLLSSSGPHENGFTPLRALAKKLPNGYRTKLKSGIEFWRAINAPSVLYTPIIRDILKSGIMPCGLENITGHGWQKLMRSKKSLTYRINNLPPELEVFTFVKNMTASNDSEMYSIFNCGAGFAIFVKDELTATKVIKHANNHNVEAVLAGEIEYSEISGDRKVIIESLGIELSGDNFILNR